jgi:hypothetical protein
LHGTIIIVIVLSFELRNRLKRRLKVIFVVFGIFVGIGVIVVVHTVPTTTTTTTLLIIVTVIQQLQEEVVFVGRGHCKMVDSSLFHPSSHRVDDLLPLFFPLPHPKQTHRDGSNWPAAFSTGEAGHHRYLSIAKE